MASVATVTLPLPALPSGWSAEKDFKAIGQLSEATQRSIEPVGPSLPRPRPPSPPQAHLFRG
ncbi:Zuotin [Fusarium falciforme]|nr:Zuotin [Fusarium falciforme]